jgi:hypothetical protein
MSVMSARQPPVPKDAPTRAGRARNVEIFMRKPAREGRPTGGLSSPLPQCAAEATGPRLTETLNRNLVGSVPDGN